MKSCIVCGAPFAPRRNSKTCSETCSAAHTARRQRAYIAAHPTEKRANEKRHREVVRHFGRRVDRAVRLLFALTGELS